jgi:hypothetical protein
MLSINEALKNAQKTLYKNLKVAKNRACYCTTINSSNRASKNKSRFDKQSIDYHQSNADEKKLRIRLEEFNKKIKQKNVVLRNDVQKFSIIEKDIKEKNVETDDGTIRKEINSIMIDSRDIKEISLERCKN